MKCKYKTECFNNGYGDGFFDICGFCDQLREIFPEDELYLIPAKKYIDPIKNRRCTFNNFHIIDVFSVINSLKCYGFSNEAIREIWNNKTFEFMCCDCFKRERRKKLEV